MIVDSRQPPNLRLVLTTLGWVQSALDAGDYRFQAGRWLVGVESKLPPDLVSSLHSRQDATSRLKDQLLRLRDAVEVPILLLGGVPGCNLYGWTQVPGQPIALPYSSITNALLSAQVEGILVAIGSGSSVAAGVRDIQAIQRWAERTAHTFLFPVERKYTSDRRLLALRAIPGISAKLAAALMEKFPTLLALAQADAAAIAEAVSGIGPTKAQSIFRFWRDEWK